MLPQDLPHLRLVRLPRLLDLPVQVSSQFPRVLFQRLVQLRILEPEEPFGQLPLNAGRSSYVARGRLAESWQA